MSLAEQALPGSTRTILDARAVAGRSPHLRRALVTVDISALVLGWGLAFSLVSSGPAVRLARLAAVTAVSLAVLAGQHLYRSRVCASPLVELAGLVKAAVASVLAGAAAVDLTGGTATPVPMVVGGLLSLALLIPGRAFYTAWMRAERSRGRFTRPVAIVGSGDEVGRVVELLHHHPELGYRVTGLVGNQPTARRHGLPWLGEPAQGVAAAVASGATGVVVVPGGFVTDELNGLLRDFLARGIHVRLSSGLWRMDHRRLKVSPLAHEPFLYLEPTSLSGRQRLVKRVLDIGLGSIVLLVTAPFLLVAALAVKLGDGGPILFRQTRIGRDGRPFTLLKFRTMTADAESRLVDLADHNRRDGPLFKVDADPRVTKVGRFLRATSLDELPQLFNVLGGSMSLVGPRPALPDEVARFDDDLLDRHRLPPGMTGLWQIEARENTSFYAYRHLDLFYVDNWSPTLDLLVLVSTVPVVLARAVRSLLGRADLVAEVR
jgi:exopolysaccharide biosynthesis polyprenyl glycosylphosphotransferase